MKKIKENNQWATKTNKEDGSVSYTLLSPLKVGDDTTIETLTFKVPKAKHIRFLKFNDPTMDQVLLLAGKLCGQPPSVMDEIEMDDLFGIADVVVNFLGNGVLIGKTA